jgi:hypothetical protein
MEWRREINPPQKQETQMKHITKGFPRPRPRPSEVAAALALALVDPVFAAMTQATVPADRMAADEIEAPAVVEDADIDYLPESDAAVLTEPLQPAVPRPAPRVVDVATASAEPVRPTATNAPDPMLTASKPIDLNAHSIRPRPSFLPPRPTPGYELAGSRSVGGIGRVTPPPAAAATKAPAAPYPPKAKAPAGWNTPKSSAMPVGRQPARPTADQYKPKTLRPEDIPF